MLNLSNTWLCQRMWSHAHGSPAGLPSRCVPLRFVWAAFVWLWALQRLSIRAPTRVAQRRGARAGCITPAVQASTMADADTAMDGSASRPSSNGSSGPANGAASAAKPAPLASTGDVVGSRLVGAWVPKVGAAGLWLCVRARACMCVCGWVRMWVDASPGMWPCVDARTLSTASMCACKTSCWARWTCSGCVRAFNSACGCYA